MTAIVRDLDACVATAKSAGDTRTPDQIRADEIVHRMTLGAFGAPASRDVVRGAGVRALRVSLTMPLSTWLGIAGEPAVLDDYGPIPAALARQMAGEAARDYPETTTGRCVADYDVHRTVLGVGDTIPTPRHDPPPRLREFVATADASCAWPNCSRRAQRCDLDHRVAHERGGATCACNMQALCRKHHRLKGTGLVTSRSASTETPTTATTTGTSAPRTIDDKDADSAHDADVVASPAATGGGDHPAAVFGAHVPVDVHPVGSVTWQSWTGRSYTSTPPVLEEKTTDGVERALAAVADRRRRLLEESWRAGPDDDGDGSGPRSATTATAGGAVFTLTEAWDFAVTRDDRRTERAVRERTVRDRAWAHAAAALTPTEPPF